MSETFPPSLMAQIAAEINMMNTGRPRQSKDRDAYNEAQAYAADYEDTLLPLLRSMQHTSDPETMEPTSNLLQWMRDHLGSPPKDSLLGLATTCVPTSQLSVLDDEHDNGRAFKATIPHRSARRLASQERRPAPQNRRPVAPRGDLSCGKMRTKAQVDAYRRDARRAKWVARFGASSADAMPAGLSEAPPSPPTEEMEACSVDPPSPMSSDFTDVPQHQKGKVCRGGKRTPRSGSMRGGGAWCSLPYIIGDVDEDAATLGDIDTEPEEHDNEEQFVRDSMTASYQASRMFRPPPVDAGGPRPDGPESSHDAHSDQPANTALPSIPESEEDELTDDGSRAERAEELAAWRASFDRQGQLLEGPCERVVDYLILREQAEEQAKKARRESRIIAIGLFCVIFTLSAIAGGVGTWEHYKKKGSS